jgi:hypothetical protein
VKKSLPPHANREAAESDAQDSADRKIDDKKMTLHHESLAFFCHQSLCQIQNLRTVQKLGMFAMRIVRILAGRKESWQSDSAAE